ncbi:vacuolar fusion protein MON1 homolog A-like [Dendronephthya gigantea]|uniref:vacuolar fusion protein MON1 homolog A-like n=1 Tax=Dendronephthya gigantea TaxID=151771 RepID=UPI0010692E72|nr:vacuolar fusion protein MON1 homolog A-like [Dendronephthya gigantea]XP_028406839.1 vacuolar fusion protein MON1 homolog A-like [Dendronephthya gigantea]
MAEAVKTAHVDGNKRDSLEVNTGLSGLPADCLQGHEPGAGGCQLFEAVKLDDFDDVYEEHRELISSSSSGRLASLWGAESPSDEFVLIKEGEESQANSSARSRLSSERKISDTIEEGIEVIVENMRIQDHKDDIVQQPEIPSDKESALQNERSTPEHVDEDVNHPDWIKHKKHIFVLSSAGKPIYSRYGNEDKLSTLTGVMQALVSFVEDENNHLRAIVAGDHKFVFLVKGHVILVAISYAKESEAQMAVQLTHVYNQILSVLTLRQLERIMNQRGNYDLRRLLGGTEKFIDSLLNLMDHEPSVLLGAVRCLPLKSSMRDIIGQSFVQNKVKELVFAVLIARNQLITLVRPKSYSLHPGDLHLILNLVNGSTSFQTAESWTPICLPRFDNSGYLYAHVSYLSDDCPACLLLLTTASDAFFILSECRLKVLEKLKRYKCFEAINEALGKESYRIGDVGIPNLLHFVYKSRSTSQYTSPELEAPYNNQDEEERLFGLYLYLHHHIHSSGQPLKILCHVGSKEMLLGWVTSGFELYATFNPLVTKPIAINAINKLLKWITNEEDRLFILNSPVF